MLLVSRWVFRSDRAFGSWEGPYRAFSDFG